MSDYYSAADFSTGSRKDRPREAPRPGPVTGDYWDSRPKGGPSGSGTTSSSGVVAGSSYRKPEGVAVSRVPMSGGVYGSQRMGFNPDAWERFPYGVRYTSASAGTAAWTDLTPAYRDYIDTLAKHPNIGSKTSTGRMLWERMNTLAADRLSQGENISAQMLVAELANSVGISSDLGFAAEQFSGASSGGGYSGGGYGGGGGGGATSQRIDLTSYTGAQALLTQFMQSSMGRSPKAKEVGEFYKLLKQYQTNNPTVVSASGNTVTQSGGVDAGVVAQEFVETLPDYTEGQADKYYRVFMSALLGGA